MLPPLRPESPLSSLLVLVLTAIFAVSCGGASPQDSSQSPGSSGGTAPERPQKTVAEETGAAQVASMDVSELVGQMFVVSVQGTRSDYYIEKMIRERNIGGAILFEYNMKSKGQVKSFASSMQDLSMKTDPAIPMFVSVDYEGGEIAGAPWVSPEPAAAEVGATGDPPQARATSERIGTQLLDAGVNTDFAPVVDTGFGAAIGSRAYGEDPALVSRMGVASSKGFEDAGVVYSAKHFPNHGPARTDSHESLPVIDHDLQTVKSYDLPPFEAAIDAGVPMVMVGHLVYPAIDPENPASLSPKAYSMLRDDLGFRGVAVTDDLAMDGANGGGPPADAAVKAVEAGADLMIISSPPEEQAAAYDAVLAAVESGEIPEERVRQSVERILSVKKEYGLYATAER